MPVLIALTTLLSTFLGGTFALRNRGRLHLILGFTAGILLGVVAFDLLPEIFELADPTGDGIPTIMVLFAAGFVALHIVERAAAIHHAQDGEYGRHHHAHVGVVSAGALVAHSFLDGVSIGLGFQAGEGVGVAVAVAVIAHDFADGLNTVTLMLVHGNSTRASKIMLGLDAIAPVLGAAVTLLFSVPDHVLSLYLAFFAGFLLYLATVSILPEAHRERPSRLTLVLTLAGAGVMYAVVSAI